MSTNPIGKIPQEIIDQYNLSKEFVEYAERIENIEIACTCLQCGKKNRALERRYKNMLMWIKNVVRY